MKYKVGPPIKYEFILKDRIAIECKVTKISTGEEKIIDCVWPPSAVTRSAYLAFGLDLPEDLK